MQLLKHKAVLFRWHPSLALVKEKQVILNKSISLIREFKIYNAGTCDIGINYLQDRVIAG